MTIKKGVERTVVFKMVDETDFATPETGLSVTCEISKDGGSFAGTTNSAAEIGNGWYKITLTATEMSADEIILKSSYLLPALSVWEDGLTVEEKEETVEIVRPDNYP